MQIQLTRKIRTREDTYVQIMRDDAHVMFAYPTNFRNVNMEQALLNYLTIDEADFSRCYGFGAVIDGCRFQNSKWVDAYLRESKMRGIDLRGADFTGANLQYVDFTGADLRGANLTGADLYMTDFTEANMEGVVRPENDI